MLISVNRYWLLTGTKVSSNSDHLNYPTMILKRPITTIIQKYTQCIFSKN